MGKCYDYSIRNGTGSRLWTCNFKADCGNINIGGSIDASVLDVYNVNLYVFSGRTELTCCHKVSLVVAVESPITMFWHCQPSSKNVGSSTCMTLAAGMSTFWNVGRSCTCLI